MFSHSKNMFADIFVQVLDFAPLARMDLFISSCIIPVFLELKTVCPQASMGMFLFNKAFQFSLNLPVMLQNIFCFLVYTPGALQGSVWLW